VYFLNAFYSAIYRYRPNQIDNLYPNENIFKLLFDPTLKECNTSASIIVNFATFLISEI
jgi:hypothetical protein